jgi:hypothetical protein
MLNEVKTVADKIKAAANDAKAGTDFPAAIANEARTTIYGVLVTETTLYIEGGGGGGIKRFFGTKAPEKQTRHGKIILAATFGSFIQKHPTTLPEKMSRGKKAPGSKFFRFFAKNYEEILSRISRTTPTARTLDQARGGDFPPFIPLRCKSGKWRRPG